MNFIIRSLVLAALLLLQTNASAQTTLDLGGYMQTWYIANQQTEFSTGETINTNGFRLRRARITARGELNERFSATIWTDLAGSNNILLDFYADAKFHPAFNIRFGQFIMPGQSFDTARLVSSRLIFWERPGVSTALASGMGFDAFRDIGVMVYGRHKNLWYGVHAGNGTGRFTQAGTHITQRKAGGGLYGARVDYELSHGLTIGGHISTNQQRDVVERDVGPFDIDRTSRSLRIAKNNLGIDRLYTQFEYMWLQANDDSYGVRTGLDGTYDLDGFYVEIGYGITKKWHILGRYDRMNQEPGQAGGFTAADSFKRDQFTLVITRFLFHNDREIFRAHLNYALGSSSPDDLNSHILVLVMQLRFIPI